MTEPITIEQLKNASLDAATLEQVINGDDNTDVTSRLGATYPTLDKALKTIIAKGGLNATGYATYQQMTSSVLPEGSHAIVTNDPDKPKNGLYVKQGGVWVYADYNPDYNTIKKMTDLILRTDTSMYAGAFADEHGNMALGIRHDGSVDIPVASIANTDINQDINALYAFAITDNHGNIAFAIKHDGTIYAPGLQSQNTANKVITAHNSDAILIVGDSYSASHYTVKDKAYISNLSNLLPFRFKNIAISGDESLDMTARINKDIAYFDAQKPQSINARYAVIASYTNDGTFRGVNLAYYKANLTRLVHSIKACGIEPILATEFPIDAPAAEIVRQIANEQGIRYIDAHKLNYEIGNLAKGPFHQGHPGTRTNGVFWLPMYDALSKLQAKNTIKIYRKRPQFVVNNISDLLCKDSIDKYTKYKELSVSHQRLADANARYYDELDGNNVYTYTATPDEYLRLGNGGVSCSDYALIELTIDGTAQTLESLTLNIDTDAQVYVRNYFDTPFAGKRAGTKPVQQDYIAGYDKPVGVWQAISGNARFDQKQLKGVLLGDKMQLLLVKTDGFVLKDVDFSYVGGGKNIMYNRPFYKVIGDNVLTNPTFDAMQHWQGGATTIVPIDKYNAPRQPNDRTQPINQVAVVNSTNSVRQTVALPKLGTRYRLTVWARHYPKAFLDNSKYQLDASQVIDRSSNNSYPANSEITSDSVDLRRLTLKYAFADNLTLANTVTTSDFVALMWRGVEFDIDVPDAPLGVPNFTFDLSCLDGQIQLAKVTLQEIN